MFKQLMFSLGHVFAFIAIIFISYVTFMGATYLSDGDFTYAGIVTAVVAVFLVIYLYVSQLAKAASRNFTKWIWVERFFVFSSPIAFVLLMSTYSHFWTVHSKDEAIVKEFAEVINASRQMFTDYDWYAEARIADYQDRLNEMFPNTDQLHNRTARVSVLELQLRSQNYDSLRNVALKWIDESDEGASTWNAFLLANKTSIMKAVRSWNEQLADFSMQQLKDEGRIQTFGEVSDSFRRMEEGFDKLTDYFTSRSFPHPVAIVSGLILFVALCLPYLIQDRNPKSFYRLLGDKGGDSAGQFPSAKNSSSSNKYGDVFDF